MVGLDASTSLNEVNFEVKSNTFLCKILRTIMQATNIQDAEHVVKIFKTKRFIWIAASPIEEFQARSI